MISFRGTKSDALKKHYKNLENSHISRKINKLIKEIDKVQDDQNE